MPNGLYIGDVPAAAAAAAAQQPQQRSGGSATMRLALPSDPAHPVLDPQMSPDGAFL